MTGGSGGLADEVAAFGPGVFSVGICLIFLSLSVKHDIFDHAFHFERHLGYDVASTFLTANEYDTLPGRIIAPYFPLQTILQEV